MTVVCLVLLTPHSAPPLYCRLSCSSSSLSWLLVRPRLVFPEQIPAPAPHPATCRGYQESIKQKGIVRVIES